MNEERLSSEELVHLIERVFKPSPTERTVAILVDLPDRALPDNDDWLLRRQLAAGWATTLRGTAAEHGLEIGIFGYRNVRANNADLPATACPVDPVDLPEVADDLPEESASTFDSILGAHAMVLAPTELSTTAPLKVLAPNLGFRAATMPGFSEAMIPALRLDYGEVNRRVWWLKERLDAAVRADIRFVVEGLDSPLELVLDLRHRTAHASGGLLPEPGTAGNLPSGEAYIVPYEGELPGDPTATSGLMPIQFGDEVVIFRIEENRAVGVTTDGTRSQQAEQAVTEEPPSGNVAELGLGVLSDFGVKPIGEVLLDEKLGLHIAFGRSEHFGGPVGPDQFSHPSKVIHQDHVYLPELQPRVNPAAVILSFADGSQLELMRDGRYTVDFDQEDERQ